MQCIRLICSACMWIKEKWAASATADIVNISLPRYHQPK
jgi:hypothetical protein